MKDTLLKLGEGLAVFALGVFFLCLSLQIPDNPIPAAGSGAAVWLLQARALPVLLSGCLSLLGIRLTLSLRQGKGRTRQGEKRAEREAEAESGLESDGKEEPSSTAWTLLLCAVSVVWLAVSAAAGLVLPSVLYLILMLQLCGRREGRSPLVLLAAAILYSLAALWLLPGLLKIPI